MLKSLALCLVMGAALMAAPAQITDIEATATRNDVAPLGVPFKMHTGAFFTMTDSPNRLSLRLYSVIEGPNGLAVKMGAVTEGNNVYPGVDFIVPYGQACAYVLKTEGGQDYSIHVAPVDIAENGLHWLMVTVTTNETITYGVVTPMDLGRHFNARPSTSWGIRTKNGKVANGTIHIEGINKKGNKPSSVDLQVCRLNGEPEIENVVLDEDLLGSHTFRASIPVKDGVVGVVRTFVINFDGRKAKKGGIDAVFESAPGAAEEDDSVGGAEEEASYGVVNMRNLGQHFLCSDKTNWGVRDESHQFLVGFSLHTVLHKAPTPTPTVPKNVPAGVSFSVFTKVGGLAEPFSAQLNAPDFKYTHHVTVNGEHYTITFDGLTAMKLGVLGVDAVFEKASSSNN